MTDNPSAIDLLTDIVQDEPGLELAKTKFNGLKAMAARSRSLSANANSTKCFYDDRRRRKPSLPRLKFLGDE